MRIDRLGKILAGFCCIAVMLKISSRVVLGGSYPLAFCDVMTKCELRGVALQGEEPPLVTPFGIVHPPGYDGTGGVLSVGICTDNPFLVGPVEKWRPSKHQETP